MNETYLRLLDGTIQHLESLRSSGVTFVPVQAETLAALAREPAPAAPIRPTAAPATRPDSFLAPVPTPTIPRPVAAISPAAESVNLLAEAPEDRTAAMSQLQERALICQKCPNLAASRKNVVFGVGDIHAQLMFVGEAPGADEDQAGEPFVGKAGQLLTKIIETMGFSRQTVYIANILKCRPDTPGQAYGNRKPTLDEMKTCSPYLLAQIDLIKPKVIVALGATAVEGLLANFAGITKLRGNWQTFRGVPVMPTFHPAYLLRNQAITEKRKVWEDMLKVLEKLGAPVTEKQRGFFLKAG